VHKKFTSSYLLNGFEWLRGNLHTHSTNSDGETDPVTTAEHYARLGYDFLAITDHDFLTTTVELNGMDLIILPGAEITDTGPHVVVLGIPLLPAPSANRQEVLSSVAHQNGVSFLCHPNWEEHFNHCDQRLLETLHGYAGIEIVNHVCRILPGSGYAFDRWDRLLAKGRKVWGFANDDCHELKHAGRAWNVVQSVKREAGAVLDSLKAGRFYATTGITIESISWDSESIRIKAQNTSCILAYGDNQRLLKETLSDEIIFTLEENSCYSYVRFECLGCGGSAAWTQPFFVETDEDRF